MSDEARLVRIETDIKLINKNVAKLYSTMKEVTTADAIWRKTMCTERASDIRNLKGDMEEIKPKVNSKWPALIAAFAGSLVSTVVAIAAFVAIVKGVSP